MQFTVVVVEDLEEGGYNATVPALPGCRTFGESVEETLERAYLAIGAYIASLKKHHESIPHEADSQIMVYP